MRRTSPTGCAGGWRGGRLSEFELLKFLAQHGDQVYSREQLLTIVWEYEYIGVDSEKTVDVTVRRLREKIEIDPSNPEFVITKRGVGYYFAGIP